MTGAIAQRFKNKDDRRIKLFLHFKIDIMAIVKVIEVIASSKKGIDDAIQSCVKEVSKTIKNIDSVYVKDIKVKVNNGKIDSYGVICNVSFTINDKLRAEDN